MKHFALVGLGSNMGDSRKILEGALKTLDEADGIRVQNCSAVYATAPVGEADQPPFLNLAARLETELSPQRLLGRLFEVETRFGRVRTVHWGPRTLDLDLLFYEDEIMDEPGLRLPHPEVLNRGFVLEPLAEIAPEWIHPVFRKTVRQLCCEWEERVGEPSKYVVRREDYLFKRGEQSV